MRVTNGSLNTRGEEKRCERKREWIMLNENRERSIPRIIRDLDFFSMSVTSMIARKNPCAIPEYVMMSTSVCIE